MSELPHGWEWSTLGEVGRYLNGRGFKKTEWAETGRPIIRIQNLTGSTGVTNYFDGHADERHVVQRGDLLVSWAATLGVFVWDGPEAVLNQHIFKVESYVDSDYHRYLLENVLADLRRQAHGSGMVHVTKSKFDGTPVAVPPLAEQRRIVAAIEEHFSRLDVAQASIRLAERREKALCQSILSAANDPAWPELPLRELIDDIEAGKSFKTPGRPAEPNEWGVIKVSAMTWGEFDENENKAVLDVDRINPRFQIERGDLLLSRANTSELVGATVLVGDRRDRLLLSDKSMRLITRPEVDRRWLRYCLGSPALRAQMSAVATGTSDSMRNISQAKVRALRVRVPTPSAQKEIAEQISERLATATRLSNEVELAERKSSALRRSILAASFSGRLVPQDPSDEPASVLLERIATERAASKPSRRKKAAS